MIFIFAIQSKSGQWEENNKLKINWRYFGRKCLCIMAMDEFFFPPGGEWFKSSYSSHCLKKILFSRLHFSIASRQPGPNWVFCLIENTYLLCMFSFVCQSAYSTEGKENYQSDINHMVASGKRAPPQVPQKTDKVMRMSKALNPSAIAPGKKLFTTPSCP